jgi:hypothetical protein
MNSADNVVIPVIVDVAKTSRDKLTMLEKGVNMSTNLSHNLTIEQLKS